MTNIRKNKKISMRAQRIIGQTSTYIVLLIFASVVLVPFAMVILSALKNNAESAIFSLQLPSVFQFENFRYVWEDAKILRYLINSIILAVPSVLCVVFLSSPASFIIVRRAGKSFNFLYNFFVIGLIAPLSIVPSIILHQTLGTMDTYGGVILIHIAVNIPFSTFLFSSFIKGIPREIDEAAIIDGCGPVRLFYEVIFPLLKPVIFTSVVIAFMNIWNDFRISLFFINSSARWTLPLSVYQFMGQYTNRWNYISVHLIYTITPVIIVYLAAQKYIVGGMTAGSVKG